MNFSYYDLGQRKAGEMVEIQLSAGANVLLLDSANYSAFMADRQHRYYGGLAKRTPVRLSIPRSGHWFVVIHMAGLRGSVRHSMRMVPGALPELRQPDLRSIVEDVVAPDPASPLPVGAEEFDLFISHATEDKDGIVRDLVEALSSRGVKVWYDEFQLRIGDSLRRKIDAGLARSRFGLVVVSHAFFAKNWPQYELDGLVSLEMAGRQRILPVWHNITKDEVLDYSPSLADKVALSTGTFTVEEIAAEIADVVNDSGREEEAA
jgi:Domain of unknown function (DUF1883)/TIR domain